jgi:L-lactate utilization protein LutB
MGETRGKEGYWSKRLQCCQKALEANGFEAFVAKNPQSAKAIVLEQILPATGAKTVSWGDSLTLGATGLLDAFSRRPDITLIRTFDATVSREVIIKRRRQALLADLFLTGSNAVTEAGQLVNLDMVGNRVAGMIFGPKTVVIFIGRNKIVPDLASAKARIKGFAAPVNAMRHDFSSPCTKTARCMDCKSPTRICNTWAIFERCHPPGRIKVVLIDADLGY